MSVLENSGLCWGVGGGPTTIWKEERPGRGLRGTRALGWVGSLEIRSKLALARSLWGMMVREEGCLARGPLWTGRPGLREEESRGDAPRGGARARDTQKVLGPARPSPPPAARPGERDPCRDPSPSPARAITKETRPPRCWPRAPRAV